MKNHQTSFLESALYMSLSAVCLSIFFLFLKLELPHLPFLLIAFLRFSIAFCILLAVLLIRRQWKKDTASSVSLASHLTRVAFMTASQYGFLFYLEYNSLLNASVLLNTSPFFIPLIEKIFWGSKIGKSTWISLIVSAIGVLLILQPQQGLFNIFVVIGLFSAIMLSFSQVLYSIQSKSENQIANLYYLFLMASIISFLVYIAALFFFPSLSKSHANLNSTSPLNQKWSLLFLFLMGLFSLSNQWFRGLAYRKSRAGTLATFLYLSVLISGFFDWIIFHRLPNAWSIIGAFLVIIGGILKIFIRKLILQKKDLQN